MTEPTNADQISRAYKECFATRAGQIVLDHLGLFCMAKYNQNPADPTSTNQTYYNLGAFTVYRMIRYQMDLELGQRAEECIMDPEQGE
jgi:hypothetical protein